MDYVHVDGFRVSGKHGYHAKERSIEQEFEVSLNVGTDLSQASQSDALVDTISYSDLKKIIIAVFARESRYLIEALAGDIATEILKDPRAHEVTVTIKKIAVWDNGTPGITIYRKRRI